MRLYRNQRTNDVTADYGKALDWRQSGDGVSEYQKHGEL